MAPSWPAAAACLVALLATGCADPPMQSPAEPEAPARPPHPAHLELTDCSGWDGRSMPYPAFAAPGQTPPGWEPKDPSTPTTVMMGGYTCRRLAIGPFERGPVRLLFDAHDRADFPGACRQANGAQTDLEVLNSLWLDDAEVAAYLRDELGIPAHASTINETVEDAGPVRLRTWSWGEGQARSAVTAVDDGTAATWLPGSRLFWPRGDGLGALVLAYQRDGSAYAGRAGHGTLQPPMLLADMPGGLLLGVTKWYPSMSAQGTVALYRDRACQEPEP